MILTHLVFFEFFPGAGSASAVTEFARLALVGVSMTELLLATVRPTTLTLTSVAQADAVPDDNKASR